MTWRREIDIGRVSQPRDVNAGKAGGGETHPLDDLGLLDEESANDAVTDAVGATRSSVSALNGLLSLRDLSVFTGAKGRDLCGRRQSVGSVSEWGPSSSQGETESYTGKSDVAVTALGGGGRLLDLDETELST